MRKFEKRDEVYFFHPIFRVRMKSEVYDMDYQGDPANWRILVRIGDGNLTWKLVADCTPVTSVEPI
jgi:hypothetical protein